MSDDDYRVTLPFSSPSGVERSSISCGLFAVKGVNFYGPQSEFIVSGSDCGNVYLWHHDSEKIVNFFHADDGGVVCKYCVF